MCDTTEIARLIRKKIEGTITAKELALLADWAKQNSFNAELLAEIEDEGLVLGDALSWFQLKKGDKQISWTERLEQKTFSKIKSEPSFSNALKRLRFKRLLPLAAAALILCVFSLIYYQQNLFKDDIITITDLQAGTNRASVTLADGHVITLNGDQKGIILGEELTYEDGTLVCELEEGPVSYAELKTPRGGHYQITLCDGTRVWLNADSKLTYPSRFDGDVRLVKLEGEAYFEVVSYQNGDKYKPFIVSTAQQEVEVLGTAFNVKAYADDNNMATTLVEGSVKISRDEEVLFLVPGEQGVTDKNRLIKRKADIEQSIAWKNNEFIFDETELKDAMKMLGRWYDFDVVYEESIPITHFYGTIDRNQSLAEVLKIMQTSGLKYRIQKDNGQNRLFILR